MAHLKFMIIFILVQSQFFSFQIRQGKEKVTKSNKKYIIGCCYTKNKYGQIQYQHVPFNEKMETEFDDVGFPNKHV